MYSNLSCTFTGLKQKVKQSLYFKHICIYVNDDGSNLYYIIYVCACIFV